MSLLCFWRVESCLRLASILVSRENGRPLRSRSLARVCLHVTAEKSSSLWSRVMGQETRGTRSMACLSCSRRHLRMVWLHFSILALALALCLSRKVMNCSDLFSDWRYPSIIWTPVVLAFSGSDLLPTAGEVGLRECFKNALMIELSSGRLTVDTSFETVLSQSSASSNGLSSTFSLVIS